MGRNLQEQPFYGVIREFTHWVVLFRERQVTIGSVIIMAKDTDKASLGALSAEAWGEFGSVTAFVEHLLHTTFGAEKYNYLALMMYDPEVHFHVIPRYSTPVIFKAKEYVDPDWPQATKRVAMELDSDTLDAIKDELIKTSERIA